MKTCPYCMSECFEKNDGMGIYYVCSNCQASLHTFSLLKRLNFDSRILSSLLQESRQNQTQFQGNCTGCNAPFRKVFYEINNYKTNIHICPRCMLFAIKKIDFDLFKNKTELQQTTQKKYSAETEKLLNEINKKIVESDESWENYDKSAKISRSKRLGFFFLLFIFIIAFARIGFLHAATNFWGKFLFFILFMFCLLALLYFLVRKKDIIGNIKKYFFRT